MQLIFMEIKDENIHIQQHLANLFFPLLSRAGKHIPDTE